VPAAELLALLDPATEEVPAGSPLIGETITQTMPALIDYQASRITRSL
jgi:hypothetical protein